MLERLIAKLIIFAVLVVGYIIVQLIKQKMQKPAPAQPSTPPVESTPDEVLGPAPGKMTPEELAAASDWDLTMRVYDYIMGEMDYKLGRREQYQRLEALSRGIAAVRAVTEVNDEVCNGGYVQYFVNTRGEVSDLALKGYEVIGAPEHAEMFKQALAAAAEEIPEDLDQKSVQDLMLLVHESHVGRSPLDQLDDRYYELNRKDDIFDICGRYIRSHPAEFTF